jgi:septum formation protein
VNRASGSPVSLILASGSATRADLLRRAGLSFTVETAAVDETEIKASFHAKAGDPVDCAMALAQAKAFRVSRRHPGALVIGADQMLVCDGIWFDKPSGAVEAREQLLALRGRRHELISALCVVRDGQRIWHVVDRPSLLMRAFSDEFLDLYLADAGPGLLSSVGAYQLEGSGCQLFAEITGDYFSILGVPLLPLLAVLRDHGVIAR